MDNVNAFCTLFDSSYLSRGLLMIESLLQHFPSTHIYVFAFDQKAHSVLTQLKLPKVSLISLQEFEDPELLAIKASRSVGEYCWTCTASTLLFCLKNYSLRSCTYVDADLFFSGSPSVIFSEMGEKSVLITPHWYTPKYNQSQTSGIYCVQFVTVKNNAEGLAVLNWWRKRCIEWCYARIENGKFGDQKYLDDWPTRFPGVHVLQNRGGGMAPWNIQQYRPIDESHWEEVKTQRVFQPIFYHYHALKRLESDGFSRGDYDLSAPVLSAIYIPYEELLLKKDRELEHDFGVVPRLNKITQLNVLQKMKRYLVQAKSAFIHR